MPLQSEQFMLQCHRITHSVFRLCPLRLPNPYPWWTANERARRPSLVDGKRKSTSTTSVFQALSGAAIVSCHTTLLVHTLVLRNLLTTATRKSLMQQCNTSNFSCRSPCFLNDTNDQHLPNLIPSKTSADSVVASDVILDLKLVSSIRPAESASTGSVASSDGTAVAFSNDDADPNKNSCLCNWSLPTPIGCIMRIFPLQVFLYPQPVVQFVLLLTMHASVLPLQLLAQTELVHIGYYRQL